MQSDCEANEATPLRATGNVEFTHVSSSNSSRSKYSQKMIAFGALFVMAVVGTTVFYNKNIIVDPFSSSHQADDIDGGMRFPLLGKHHKKHKKHHHHTDVVDNTTDAVPDAPVPVANETLTDVPMFGKKHKHGKHKKHKASNEAPPADNTTDTSSSPDTNAEDAASDTAPEAEDDTQDGTRV